MATEKKKWVLLENVINGGPAVDLPKPVTKKNLDQVWTLLNKDKLKTMGLVHFQSAFMEDRMHDWDITKQGKLRFYGHSGGKDEIHTLVLVYK
ncbi:MAG: hypothetical protein ABWX90_03275 [Candidatus Saccharimonadales bacterium]